MSITLKIVFGDDLLQIKKVFHCRHRHEHTVSNRYFDERTIYNAHATQLYKKKQGDATKNIHMRERTYKQYKCAQTLLQNSNAAII